ncbi:hypothetical protein RHMOL_Rhmol08G0122000 [Rhododendron molle]|uniref:Uncharacterized protein n=1 Tax=Rhododendron molle TaxID=49168 RepID=A0ACC0MPL0_RHOML|nr:hypothetical protein RHMOL_Rhmol08G0122000 [Rhododendron molle]
MSLLVLIFLGWQLADQRDKKGGGRRWQSVVVVILVATQRFESTKTCEDASQSLSLDSLRFEFSTIRAVTNDFSNANMVGHGGFGSVYKGKLANGQEIAVKRLDGCSEQGEGEFKNEIALMARLQHRNLVRLLGFCFEGKERLLIYEFVPNASLDRFIFVSNDKIQGTFLKKDDPRILALMQQAELLSSLAVKVNMENTDQSLQNAWKRVTSERGSPIHSTICLRRSSLSHGESAYNKPQLMFSPSIHTQSEGLDSDDDAAKGEILVRGFHAQSEGDGTSRYGVARLQSTMGFIGRETCYLIEAGWVGWHPKLSHFLKLHLPSVSDLLE